jgi:hypothetical protein
MKNLTVCALAALVVAGCKKTDTPPQPQSLLICNVGAKTWTAEKVSIFGSPENFDVSAENIYPGIYYETHELLYVKGLNAFSAKHTIKQYPDKFNPTIATAMLNVGSADASEGDYIVFEQSQSENVITINSYNAATKEINASFAISMYTESPHNALPYGDTIKVHNGRFRLYLGAQ